MSIKLEEKITKHNRLSDTVKTMERLHSEYVRSENWNYRNGIQHKFAHKISGLLSCGQSENAEIDRIISDMMDDIIGELKGILNQDAEKIAAIEKLLAE